MQRFLAAYQRFGTLTLGCRAAGIDPATYYRWRSDDAEFAEAVRMADQRVRDTLEAEAQRRALAGRSDALLMCLLRAHDPERYGRYREVKSHADLRVASLPPAAIKRLTSEEIASLRRIIRRLQGLPVEALPPR